MSQRDRHRLDDESARLAAFERLTEGNFFKFSHPESQEEYIWQIVDAVLDAPAASEDRRGLTERLVEHLTAAMALLHPGGHYHPEDPASMANIWNELFLPTLREASDSGFPVNTTLLQMAPVTAHEYRASDPPAGDVDAHGYSKRVAEKYCGCSSCARHLRGGEGEGLLIHQLGVSQTPIHPRPELAVEAKEALARFDSHGDYEAPVAALRQILQEADDHPTLLRDLKIIATEAQARAAQTEEERDRWLNRFLELVDERRGATAAELEHLRRGEDLQRGYLQRGCPKGDGDK